MPRIPRHLLHLYRERRKLIKELQAIGPTIRGSVVELRHSCGKENCRKCQTGEKHPATYISLSLSGKTKMIYLSKKDKPRMNDPTAELWSILNCKDKGQSPLLIPAIHPASKTGGHSGVILVKRWVSNYRGLAEIVEKLSKTKIPRFSPVSRSSWDRECGETPCPNGGTI